jgi:hypothetical protein
MYMNMRDYPTLHLDYGKLLIDQMKSYQVVNFFILLQCNSKYFLDRVGGRTLSVPLKTASGTDMFDLGGQWVST